MFFYTGYKVLLSNILCGIILSSVDTVQIRLKEGSSYTMSTMCAVTIKYLSPLPPPLVSV